MFSGAEPPETHPGDRHVLGERAPEDQQVSLAFAFLPLSIHFVQSLLSYTGGKKVLSLL